MKSLLNNDSALEKTTSYATWTIALVWLCSALLAPQGCKPPPPGPLEDLPSLQGLTHDPEKDPKPGQASSGEVGISQILVTYTGAFKPQVRTNLDYVQALERAEYLVKLARTKELDFGDLARRFSDDASTSPTGGDLGVISPGQLHPDMEQAAFSLGLGQVSDPIQTPTGYHVLFRHEPSEAQVSEILISYLDAKSYSPRNPRSRDRAKQLADEIHQRILEGSPFEHEAVLYSDRPNHDKGGFFPIFSKGTQPKKLEEIVWALPVGGVSEVLETPTGFHIVKRWPVRRINVRMIKFPYRTVALDELVEYIPDRNEALEQAEKFLLEASRPDTDFVEVVARSLNYKTMGQGERQEKVDRATLPLAVEKVAFKLELGQISDIIEADSSFVVVKRVP